MNKNINWSEVYEKLDIILPMFNFIRGRNSKYWFSYFSIDGTKTARFDRVYTILNEDNITLNTNGSSDSITLYNWLIEYQSMSKKEVVELLSNNQIAKGTTAKGKEFSNSLKAPKNKLIPIVNNYQSGISGLALQYFYSRGLSDLSLNNIFDNIGTGTVRVATSQGGFYNVENCLILSIDGVHLHRHELNKVMIDNQFQRFKENKKIRYKFFYLTQSIPKGRAIELAQPNNGVLGICEGVEDALSIMQVNGFIQEQQGYFLDIREQYNNHFKESFPVWCTMGLNNLENFEFVNLSKKISKLYILVDRDKNNDYSNFDNLKAIHLAKGIKVELIEPPKPYKDWNEYVMKKQSVDEKKAF